MLTFHLCFSPFYDSSVKPYCEDGQPKEVFRLREDACIGRAAAGAGIVAEGVFVCLLSYAVLRSFVMSCTLGCRLRHGNMQRTVCIAHNAVQSASVCINVLTYAVPGMLKAILT